VCGPEEECEFDEDEGLGGGRRGKARSALMSVRRSGAREVRGSGHDFSSCIPTVCGKHAMLFAHSERFMISGRGARLSADESTLALKIQTYLRRSCAAAEHSGKSAPAHHATPRGAHGDVTLPAWGPSCASS